VLAYYIQAHDGQIGHVEDFIVDTEAWAIRYIAVDTGNWWPGKKVLVAATWIEYVDWAESLVHVDLSRDQVKGSPEFDTTAPVNRAYESRLYDYYGRPVYWS
jgi:PRC-barrel domain